MICRHLPVILVFLAGKMIVRSRKHSAWDLEGCILSLPDYSDF